MPRKYQLVAYDVWGNPEDGYEVNDSWPIGHAEIDDQASDAAILAEISAGSEVEIDHQCSDDERIELIDRRDGKPVGALIVVDTCAMRAQTTP